MYTEHPVTFHMGYPLIVKGAIVHAYPRGYHRVVDVFVRDKNNLVRYERVMSETGKIMGAKPKTCHVSYCSLVDPQEIYDAECKAAANKFYRLRDLVDESQT